VKRTVHTTLDRIANRYRDLRARLAGYCNHKPWNPNPDRSNGSWVNWRCALRRGHDGQHRFRSYVWGDVGEVEFQPIPILSVRQPMVGQPQDRHMTPTRRQARIARRWNDQARAQIRARRPIAPTTQDGDR
jgi:hypothetical protein